MEKFRETQGITLVPLVITVIIIIILATVTINMAFGDNGLITQAQLAKDMTANSVVAEQEEMNSVLSEYLNVMVEDSEITPPEPETTPPTITNISTSNITSSSISITVTATPGTAEIVSYTYSITGQEPATVAVASHTFTGLTAGTTYNIQVTVTDSAGKTATQSTQATTKQTTVADAIGGTTFTETTKIADDLENPVWIPGGFHLASDSGISVEEGIVIEDNTANKNQFVWIPVGTYKTSSGSKTNELTRRQWANQNVVAEPTPVSGDSVISSYYYGEGDSRSCTIENGINSIDAFKTSATNHGGFYIGRYEQGSGNVIKAGVAPYVSVTRDQAKTYAESMYSGNASIKATTQLISSYAWDTALNFICQTNETGYILATTQDRQYGNFAPGNKEHTGAYEKDNYSKIHDLLGNCYEWTTEYSSFNGNPCVSRGGGCTINGCAAGRYVNNTYSGDSILSFRVQLYL